MRAQDDFLFAKHSFFSDFDGEKEKKKLIVVKKGKILLLLLPLFCPEIEPTTNIRTLAKKTPL